MPIFIKTETFKKDFRPDNLIKRNIIHDHINWVKKLKNKGVNIKSGFLTDSLERPGGGGLLIIECNSFREAEDILKSDPMIKNGIVDWRINQWIDVID